MRKQQQVWLEEHTAQGTLPSMANVEPTQGVVAFTNWLAKHGVTSGRAIDIGSGKGRNSIHLAEFGFEVWAMEYIEPALQLSKELASKRGVNDKIHFELSEMDQPWTYEDNYFDVAVDSFSSIDVETKEGREVYRDEMLRTLKPGGYAFVNVCSAEDEWEKDLIANHPGAEPNSTIWPQNGKFQKNYTENELREFYSEFEIVELKNLKKPAFKLGRNGTATNLWMILRKR